MASPAEIPHADEDLKSLVARFKEAPGSGAFTELAAALLVRGHAAEALRIAEHGLQLIPQSVDGRIERAAALLALGRPRVAYVELKRALAINPTNRRAMRLLGKVYVDVGVPSRAAELLAQRFKNGEGIEEGEQETTHITQAPFPMTEQEVEAAPPEPNALSVRADTEPLRKKDIASNLLKTQHDGGPPQPPPKKMQTPPPMPPKPASAIPDLFSDLTRDLGLGAPVPEARQGRVEVTQVIRRRGVARSRSPSELATIEGPIVDTTQPGKVQEALLDMGPPASPGEPPPLFDAVTSPRLQLAPFGLDDEPLFQEHMPFAVRPVEGDKESPAKESDPLGDLRETIDEDVPPDLDSALMRAALDTTPLTGSASLAGMPAGDTLIDELEDTETPESVQTAVASASPPPLNARVVREKAAEPSDQGRVEGGMPLLELSRPNRRAVLAPRLELVTPKAKPAHVVLAIVGGVFMLAYLLLLLLETPPAWAPKALLYSEGTQGHAVPAADRSKEARSSRE